MPQVFNKRTGAPQGAVYVGRGTKWGNPWHIGRDGTRARVVQRYREWAEQEPQASQIRAELRGKDLVCWCRPLLCRADVLLEIANR